jgi:hypothetical protein
MHRLTRPGASVRTVIVCWLAVLALPASASASLSWSGPTAVDPQAAGIALTRVACPSTTQCTAVDGRGQEVTFNPQAPKNPSPVVISTHVLSGISCPSTTQCTAIDVAGQEMSFNPQSATGASPVEGDAGEVPLALACPSATQCTAGDANGQVVTFNPQSPGSPTPHQIDANGIFIAVVCPGNSTTWCAAIDSSGSGFGFSPQGAPNAKGPTSLLSTNAQAASCGPSQCAAVDNAGNAREFTVPSGAAPLGGSTGPIDQTNQGATAVSGVSCPTDDECVGVDVRGAEETFSPKLPISVGVPVDPGQTFAGVSCPSASQCTGVDRDGFAVTFNPTNPAHPTVAPVDGHSNIASISCPATSQCTAVDVGGGEVTFTPGSSANTSLAAVDSTNSGLYSVSCPGVTVCVAVDGRGQEITFNPQSPGSPPAAAIDSGHALYGVHCVSGSQCTAVDDLGREITFNPQSPSKPSVFAVDFGHALLSIACPAASQCSAVDDRGAEVTFAPASPGGARPYAVDQVPATALACPATTQCTAVDGSGDEVTFDPRHPSQASALAIDSHSQLAAVACRTVTDCVAVDQAGAVVEGDPRGTGAWSSHGTSSNPLAGIACPSILECAAVDQPGDAFLGSSGPLPPVPASHSGPFAAGLAQQGTTLKVIHGRWSFAPTSYVYQWQRCNAHGRRCAPIPFAIGSSYTLTRADIGHRIRIREAAWNITGGGVPRTGRATPVVGGLVRSRASLSGIAHSSPRFTLTLSPGRGTTRLTRILLILPAGLRARRGAGLAVRGGSSRVTIRGRQLTIVLGKPLSSVAIAVQAPSLSATRQLVRQAHRHGTKPLVFTVTAAQRDGGRTRLSLALAGR